MSQRKRPVRIVQGPGQTPYGCEDRAIPDNMARTRQDFYVANDADSHFPFAFSSASRASRSALSRSRLAENAIYEISCSVTAFSASTWRNAFCASRTALVIGLNGSTSPGLFVTVAASRLDNHARSRGLRPLGRTVARGPVDHNDLAHILRQHRGHDLANRRFLVEAWNDRRNDGWAVRDRPPHVLHRLQRRPQLAQLLGGLSESSTARKS